MPKFKKKPVVIEAIQYIPHQTCRDVALFVGDNPDEILCDETDADSPYEIWTLEGIMQASPGDWIIKGVQGEFYPCKNTIFLQTYEPYESDL